MAAKLEGRKGSLWFGALKVTDTVGWGTDEGVRYKPSGGEWSAPYQEPADLQQDCESEVRRLLREVGVEFVP
jgi:hypothetical protein